MANALATPYRASVKTGTSKDMRDNWAVGFGARHTVAVWVGNFSARRCTTSRA
jgi:penicillin-binding protein 1C